MDFLATMTGALLVLITWVLVALAVSLVGLTPAAIIAKANSRSATWSSARVVRHSLWWGLLVITVWSYALNLWQPLGSGAAALFTLIFIVVLGSLGLSLTFLWRSPNPTVPSKGISWQWKLASFAVAIALVYFAFAALGPVTNYDTGLYHLGAIKYSTQYSSIPGLANLYFPLGYSNAQFPLAALLSNGPWSTNGFRLLNGAIIFLVAMDFFLRVRYHANTRNTGPGIFVLFLGFAVALLPLVALADFWVTSPTQDAAVFLLIVIATAYLVDAVHSRSGWLSNAALVGALVVLLVLFRQTSVFFAMGALVVLLLLVLRRKGSRQGIGVISLVVLVTGFISIGVSAARDYVLSGWFQYPLSLIAFGLDWVAIDPTPAREATLGFHRDPADLWNSTNGFDWINQWLVNRFAQWETYLFLALLVSVLIVVVIATVFSKVPFQVWRGISLSVLPSALALVGWILFTPPSYRFAWGPLFTILTLTAGWLLWMLAHDERSSLVWLSKVFLGIVALCLIGVTTFSFIFRVDWASMTERRQWVVGVSIPYNTTPILKVAVDTVRLDSGLEILVPIESDQCWDNYPMCTPAPTPGLELRFPGQGTIDRGFHS